MGVFIEVADGKILQSREQILTHGVGAVLADLHAAAGGEIACQRADQIDRRQNAELTEQRQEVFLFLRDERNDVVIDERFEEIAGRQRASGGKQHEQNDHAQKLFILAGIAENAQEGALGILGLAEILSAAGTGAAGDVFVDGGIVRVHIVHGQTLAELLKDGFFSHCSAPPLPGMYRSRGIRRLSA